MASREAIEERINTLVPPFINGEHHYGRYIRQATILPDSPRGPAGVILAAKGFIKICTDGAASLTPQEIVALRNFPEKPDPLIPAKMAEEFSSTLLPLFNALAEYRPTLEQALETFSKRYGDRLRDMMENNPHSEAHRLLKRMLNKLDLLHDGSEFTRNGHRKPSYASNFRLSHKYFTDEIIKRKNGLEYFEELEDELKNITEIFEEEKKYGNTEYLEMVQEFCAKYIMPAVETERQAMAQHVER